MSDSIQKKDIEVSVESDGTLVLTFRHGEVLRVHPESLAPEIQRAAMLHGLKQKLVDAAAISRDTATGRAATCSPHWGLSQAIQSSHQLPGVSVAPAISPTSPPGRSPPTAGCGGCRWRGSPPAPTGPWRR